LNDAPFPLWEHKSTMIAAAVSVLVLPKRASANKNKNKEKTVSPSLHDLAECNGLTEKSPRKLPTSVV